MRTFILAILSAVLLLPTTACAQSRVTGNKDYITKDVNISGNFTALTVNGSPDVYYTQTSGKPSVEIYATSNIVPLLDIFVEGGTLHVQYKKNTSINNPGKVEIRVSGPALSEMTVRGSGDIHLEKGMKTPTELRFRVQGSGDIKGKDIDCPSLAVNVNGSGDIHLTKVKSGQTSVKVQGSGDIYLEGTTREVEYTVQGSGDIDAANFKADYVTAHVQGSGDIKCYAVEKLTGRVNGSGDVRYKGNPEIDFPRKGLHKL